MSEQVVLDTVGSVAQRAAAPSATLRAAGEGADLRHRELLGGDFWRRLPAYRDVTEAEFLDPRWQMKHTVTKVADLLGVLQGLVSEAFLKDVEEGFRLAPMALRVSPYMLSLVDWEHPYEDPIRRQFVPTASTREPDHPMLRFDSLGEQADAPVEGLTHRYPDKALFLALDTCPVYCRFCTRSYAVGPDKEGVEKVSLKARPARWERIFEYIRNTPQLEDIVVSGGDTWHLRAAQIRDIGRTLLDIPHVRRIRFASKGPAVLPQKALGDDAWFGALAEVADYGRKLHKDVMLHTHFNHPNEITEITQRAMHRFLEAGIFVRNQTVLQRGVNDAADTLIVLGRRLAYVGVHPYYVYQHDMVKGVEELRTPIALTQRLEKEVRGTTAGFNTPMFVVDAPGGGGKRDVHSYEHYDRETGISVYTAPRVKPGQLFYYFDPLSSLDPEVRRAWQDETERQRMIDRATERAREAMNG